jgi:diguanylate cyclase (GGDEF)-like protein
MLGISEDKLRHLSEHDALTGLPNRLLLNDRLQAAIKRAQQSRSNLGLLMLDLDGFKVVNDRLGHQAGDVLLPGPPKSMECPLASFDSLRSTSLE